MTVVYRDKRFRRSRPRLTSNLNTSQFLQSHIPPAVCQYQPASLKIYIRIFYPFSDVLPLLTFTLRSSDLVSMHFSFPVYGATTVFPL